MFESDTCQKRHLKVNCIFPQFLKQGNYTSAFVFKDFSLLPWNAFWVTLEFTVWTSWLEGGRSCVWPGGVFWNTFSRLRYPDCGVLGPPSAMLRTPNANLPEPHNHCIKLHCIGQHLPGVWWSAMKKTLCTHMSSGHTALLVNPEPLNPWLTELFTLIKLTYGEMGRRTGIAKRCEKLWRCGMGMFDYFVLEISFF